MAAVCTAEAIEKVTGRKTNIKWVNDIYLKGRKVCGILTEASMDFESGGLNYAVLGIGINLSTTDFPEELKGIAASVIDSEKDIRSAVSAEFLNIFFSYYSKLREKEFLNEYRNRSILMGKQITFVRGNETFSGTVMGIDDNLQLVVRLADGTEKAFSSGEVQLVKGELIK